MKLYVRTRGLIYDRPVCILIRYPKTLYGEIKLRMEYNLVIETNSGSSSELL